MAKEENENIYIELSDFSGGIVTKVDPEDTKSNYVQSAVNVDLTRTPGAVRTRRGMVKYSSNQYSGNIDIEYQRIFATPSMIVRAGTDLWDGNLLIDWNLADATMIFTEFSDWLIMANGTDTLKYKGSGMGLRWHGAYCYDHEEEYTESLGGAFICPFFVSEKGVAYCYDWESDVLSSAADTSELSEDSADAYMYVADYLDGILVSESVVVGQALGEVPYGEASIEVYQYPTNYDYIHYKYYLSGSLASEDIASGGIFHIGEKDESATAHRVCDPILYFDNVPIPQGKPVTSAKLSFYANSSTGGSIPLKIRGELPPGAGTIDSISVYNTTTWTTAQVDWTTDDWALNDWNDSPDISDIIQEIINHSSWTSGYYMNLNVLYNAAAFSCTDCVRDYDISANAVKLSITYSDKIRVRTPLLFFRNIPIQQGQTIVSAKVKFYASESTGGSFNTTIKAQKIANASPITSAAGYNAAAWTTAEQSWTVSSWSAGSWYESTDIKAILQEIIDQSEWRGGNNILLKVEFAGTIGSSIEGREFDYSGSNRPVLEVIYRDDAGILTTYTSSVDVGGKIDGIAIEHADIARPVALGLPVPDAAPTASANSSGALTGTYKYKIGFANNSGFVGNLSQESNAVTLSNQTVQLTNIPISDDPQVTERWIYRTQNGGATFYYLGKIEDNTTTTYEDDTTDGSLGMEEETDHNAPPAFSAVGEHNSLLWGVKADAQNVVFYCNMFDEWQYFDDTNYEPFGSSTNSTERLFSLGDYLTVIQKEDIYNLNTKETPEEKALSFSDRGIQNPKAAWHTGDAIVLADVAGIFLYDTVRDILISGKVDAWFDPDSENQDRVNRSYYDKICTAYLDDRIYVSYTSMKDEATNNNTLVIFDGKAKAFNGIAYVGFTDFAVDRVERKLYAVSTDGYIYQIETGDDDDGTAIEWSFTTKDLSIEFGSRLSRKQGDFAKIDCDPNGGTITVEVILDGTTEQTITIEGSSRTVKRWRLPVDNEFYRLAFKVSGSGQQTVYNIGVMVKVLGI